MNDLPKTFQSPTMAPFCKDEVKYKVVEDLVGQIQQMKSNKVKVDNQLIVRNFSIYGNNKQYKIEITRLDVE